MHTEGTDMTARLQTALYTAAAVRSRAIDWVRGK